MKTSLPTHSSQSGFTLVELSIVLVIIGLIVGGVLAGQDMIRAAEIRSTVAQIEKYNTAVNTFRDKYGNLPGDILQVDAARFGFTTRIGTNGRGDGDRQIEAFTTTTTTLGFEAALFWRDLSQVALIDNGFVTATDALSTGLTASTVSTILPPAKIGLGHFIAAYSSGGRNYFEIARVVSTNGTGVYTLETAMTPQTAFNIDAKLDDGNPINGSVVAAYGTAALDATAPFVAGAPSAGTYTDCAFGATLAAFAYSTATDTAANLAACQLRIRAAF